ncbi:MAG: FHA domain-containing protein [Chloroflexi bacterium]|nr:FHA domain-containing protein [Chloroflexota bacterium]
MSIEVTVFLLRLLGGLILAGFLLALFYMIWRSLLQMTDALEAEQAHHARLAAIGDRNGEHRPDKSFALLPITTLGRSSSNAIVVDDEYASALHATIVLEDGRWWIEDRESRNGTQLNDQTIQGRTALADGDEISIGQCRYRLILTRNALARNRREW